MNRYQLTSHFFIGKEDTELGNYVVDPNEPLDDFHETESVTVRWDIETRIHNYLLSSPQPTNDPRRIFALTEFLSRSFSTRLTSTVQVTASNAKTYHMRNSENWLRNSLVMPETREWFEKKIDKGQDMYMIVGYQTLSDIKIAEEIDNEIFTGVALNKSASAAETPFGTTVPFATLLEVEGEPSAEFGAKERRIFRLGQEYVCAIEYRKIEWRRFSTKSVDNAFLHRKAWWKCSDNLKRLLTAEEDRIVLELTDMPDLGEGHDSRVLGPSEMLESPFRSSTQ